MQRSNETLPSPKPARDEQEERSGTRKRAAAALLREHPDAMLFACESDGHIVPPPDSLELSGRHRVLATEGRTGIDLCVAEDRVALVNAWMRLKEGGVAQAKGRLRSDPDRWMTVRLLDLRKAHGVVLNVVWPCDQTRDDEQNSVPGVIASMPARFCTRKQDQEGSVLDCDEAYLQMFGYTRDEVVGKPTFERVHPDDQARVIEGWIATVASARTQMYRIRMKRHDGSWLWVDTTLHNFLDDEEQPHVLSECIDVSAEMAAQEALQDREELLRKLIEEMPDGLLQLDSERNVVFHNTSLVEILHGSPDIAPAGAQPSDEEGSPPDSGSPVLSFAELSKTLTEGALETLDAVLEQALKEGVGEDVELEATLAFGQQRNVLMKVRPLQRDSGVVTGVIASVQDVTDSARARRELEKRAAFDALTGAHNRASIMDALTRELDTSDETGVIYLDLDRFKSVNDTFGHAAGDEVLVDVAERVKAAMRSSDDLGRLGGDEFLILLRGVPNLEEAMSAAQRISDSVRGTCGVLGGSVELCASVGVAFVEDPTLTAEELVKRADAAMYRSKEQREGLPVLAA
jgi:diguanylate cyclase (GGDEF)-like protein/PAS domain S-box-containing protein